MTAPTVVVVGLGPAGPDLLTVAATEAIAAHPVRFVRTVRHPAVEAVGGCTSFDDVYDGADTMDEVYTTIAARLADAAGRHGTVLYAVPGSPVVAERTVELLVADPSVHVELVAALSFVDLAWVRLGVDPVAVGARIVDGHEFDAVAAGSAGGLLVAQCDRPAVLEAVKLAVGDALDRAGVADADAPDLVVLARLGLPDEQVAPVPWHALDRVAADHLTSVWIPPLGVPLGTGVVRFAELVATLRRECPWDRQQTHASLRAHLLEEAHEVLEALDALAAAEAGDAVAGGDDPFGHLAEELGDLLFQVVFHATLAAEHGEFTLDDVVTGIHDKLVERHPHVFADGTATTAEQVAGTWEQAKRQAKGRASVFDGIPAGLPALARAVKVLRKAESVDGAGAVALPDPADADAGVAVGAALLAVVARARRDGIDAESALRAVLTDYERRVRDVEAGR